MNFNDLLPINSVPYMARLAVILISISEKKNQQKNSFEHRDYESVDDKSLSYTE